jgi:tetratricopeptide (TPR) repeat protein
MNGPCLCGSGLKYKRCCYGRLPGHAHLGSRTGALLVEKQNLDALHAARADVTQYTIWHKSHTVPAIRMGMPKRGSLLEIDIRALGDLVNVLLDCYVKVNQLHEFPAALERLRANIDDPRWQRKIVYFHAMAALGPDWNEPAGKIELRKLGPIEADDDEETIQVYLDLYGDELSFSQKNELIDLILAKTEKVSDRIHYKGLKAILYLMIGDEKRAEAEISEAVTQFRSTEQQANFTDYERYRFASGLELLGTIRNDQELLEEAIKAYEQLLKSSAWTAEGRANIVRQIADTCKVRGQWTRALDLYIEAYELNPREILQVFRSGCLLRLGRGTEALEMIKRVNTSELSQVEFVDYAFVRAAVAIETGDRDTLEKAKTALREAKVAEPYFREQRDELLLSVQEALTSGKSHSVVERARRVLAGVARSATSYLILRPSFMGIGVDVGKIVEDITKGSDRHSQAAASKGNEASNAEKR